MRQSWERSRWELTLGRLDAILLSSAKIGHANLSIINQIV